MIDDRHEELAALHAFGLLEGTERASFESTLATNPALAALVCELRAASATLAHLAPTATPPPSLRASVLASVNAASVRGPAPVVPFSPFALQPWFGWATAACCALAAAWLGLLYISGRSDAALLRDTQAFNALSLQSAAQQLEAERLLTRHQRSLHENELAGLTQRIGTLTAQTADLSDQLRREGDLASLKITALASLLKNSPQAIAVAVWNPAKQAGVLQVEKLPALATGQDYQLWVVDPQYLDPLDAGTFTVDPETGAHRHPIKSKQPIKNIAAYAITQEVKGGVVKSAGPFLLLGK